VDLGSQSPLSGSPNYQYCTYRFSLVNISQDVLFPIHRHMENDKDGYNKVDDLTMVDLQQPYVIVDQLGEVLEPRALESSLMMTDFSFASLSPSKCHFRDISSAQLLNGAICSLIISARGCSASFPLVLTSSTECNCSLSAVYNITAVAPPNTKKVAAMNAFPICEYPAITAFNFSGSMGGGVLSRRLSLAVDAK